MAQVDKRAERQQLIKLISQWNIDHYDIFELSQPDETNLFHGVVRFFFQGGGANVVTKCIRVASDATTNEVIDVLVEKFRPDMRMLTQSRYALYEVHVNGEERQLRGEEHPLLVQLNWGKDVREGRFLLKREDEATRKGATGEWPEQEKAAAQDQGFKRKLSKREKKEKKKREKEKNKENVDKGDASVAEKLYTDLPETSFTRSISNPEAVMRRRRQQKLEKKLQQMKGGDSDSGGVLKIYGNTIRPDVPYKTLLLSTNDQTATVVREAMEKYGIEKEDPATYCLVQIVLPPGGVEYHGGQMGEERVLRDDERPLLIVMQHPKHTGHVIFQLRRRPNNLVPGGQKRPQKALSHNDLRYQQDPKNINAEDLPFLLEMDPRGGKPKRHLLPLNVTEVGSERSMSNSSQYLQLPGNDIKPRHCVIAHTEGIVTVTPTSRDAETYVEHTRIYETTMLKDGMTVQFGKSFVFRFCDPRFEEHRRQVHPEKVMQKPGHPGYNERPHETNFDVDGHVETVNNGSSPRSPGHSPGQEWDMHRRSAPEMHQGPPDMTDSADMLPASLEFRNNDESSMLREVILEVNSRGVQFKLAPTYTLYMGSRHCLSPHIAPHMQPQQRAGRLAEYVNRISKMVQQAIQEHHNDPTALAFWMANASEILHFIKQDHDVQPFSHDAQELLAEAVQMAFQHLVRCLQVDLQRVMPAFLDPTDMEDEDDRRDPHYNSGKPTLTDVLNTLSAAMTLLRRCRVNAALTIQLFSQLFHFINMWLFNILVTEPQLQLYTRSWGIRLKRRLGRIEAWAEKQGLELAADCHLCRIIQAAHLLQAPKMTADDITNISSTCFKLNSLQLHTLLVRYIPEPREPPIAHGFIDKVVSIAKNMADELTRTDGREVRLEEDQDLHLPFLLPEDGYSCDTIRGIPNGLPEFIRPLTNAGIGKLVPNSASSGSWTVYMGDGGGRPMENTPPKSHPPQGSQPPLPRQPEVMNVVFKKVNGSMGLSIVAAMGEGQRERGIYIKSVVPNGAAALDGRLQAGDQLLEVDGRSLVGLTQDRAAELMTKTGQTVTLRVAKQGAIYHGLATLLSQPSPTMGRAASQPQNTQNRPGQMSNRTNPNIEEGPPPYTESPRDPRMYNGMEGRGQASPRLPPNQGMGRPQQMEQPHNDRFRTPSVGNLNDGRHHPNHMPHDQNMHRRDHEQDPRSKSTSNLNMDTSYERPDPGMMKPAASVAAMGPGPPGHGYPPNFGRKPNDYENQPQMNSLPNERGDPMKPGRGYTDINQNNMPVKPNHHHSQPHLHPQHRPSDRSSVSSRTSSSSNRDNRPQSAYYDTQNRDDFGSSRPKSDEITPNRIREWQEKLEDPQGPPFQNNQLQDHQSPHYNQGGPARDMNDSRNHQDIPKITVNNAPRQPNFYENTVQSQEAAPPFHQLPKQNDEKPKPRVKPKPPVKPAQQRVQPSEVPFTQVDHRQSQPQFFDPKSSPQESPNLYNPHANKQFQQPRKDPRASFGQQKKFSPDRSTGPYGYRDQDEMPPPPQDDIAPELPPPPSNDDLHESSPPLPPPPSHDYMMEQQLQDEQRRLMNQIGQPGNFNSDPRYGGPAGYNRNEYDGPPGQYPDRTRPGQSYNDRQYPNNQQNNMHPNYQNISFGGPETQPPPIPQPPEHNVYEQYEAQRQENMQPPQQQPGAMHLTVKEKEYNVGASPWNREEKEKAQEKHEEDMSRLRDMEISELESKQYLNPQEQDRLRKLRLEAEFQRRVKETMDKDEDEDSDTEMVERLYSRDRMIQAMKEDLEKSRNRLIDLERKRLIDEFESEKERLIRLERRLDQFEKDREDHKLRILKRQEKRQREHEEQLKRQREMRESQRQRFEDQKRLMMMEEEKMRQRREEELAKRKIYEREQLQQMQAARDAEEAAIRAQIRQQEEEYSRKRLERQRQERLEQQREIRVSDEKRRIESLHQQQNPNQGYDHQPYANLPPAQPERDVPQPPERNSSFNMLQRNSKRNSDYQPTNFREQQQMQKGQSVMRPGPEQPAPKKSVSFNTQLETRNTYSVGSMSGSESHPSVSSYRSSQGSQSEPADNHQYMDHQGMPPEISNEVFMSPPQNSNTADVKYIAGGTPNVVGAQEIYRDPRARIEAQKAANSMKRPGAERMSFRDKMKYFATEAGEDTIKLKAKASKSQRTIESQLNGQ